MKISQIEAELEKDLHVSRYIIFYKLILGIFELLLGTGIAIFGKQILDFYLSFQAEELFENSPDLIYNFSQSFFPYLFTHRQGIIFFLIALGVIKIAGAIGLLYRQHWGLDLLIWFTLILLPFDIRDFFLHPTITRLLFLIVNLFIAFYLLNFNPQSYFIKLHHRLRQKK